MNALSQLKIVLYEGLGREPWEVLALLGEADILLPVAALIGLWLWQTDRVREARAWGASVVASTVTVALLKLNLDDFKWAIYGHVFNTSGFPSGHVATATVFWGGLALMAAGRRAALLLFPIPIVALAVLVLRWHHTLDVVGGFAVGVASLLPLLLRAPRRSPGSAF